MIALDSGEVIWADEARVEPEADIRRQLVTLELIGYQVTPISVAMVRKRLMAADG